MERALALDFPGDGELSYDSLDRMAGDAVLVPAPPGRGEREVSIRLPSGEDWYDPFAGRLERGGRLASFAWPLERSLYLFRCGSVIPTDPRGVAVRGAGFPLLDFILIPPTDFSGPSALYREDDGESDFQEGSYWAWRFSYERLGKGRAKLGARLEKRGEAFPWTRREWRFSLPSGFRFGAGTPGAEGKTASLILEAPPESLELLIEGDYE
jgi:alpha-glucosidase (family GH31 glycosyl hydrolase)